jgi:hypothetical protein
MRGLYLEVNEGLGVGRKYHISLTKQQVRKEVREGKKVIIDKALREEKSHSRVSSCLCYLSMLEGLGCLKIVIHQNIDQVYKPILF